MHEYSLMVALMERVEEEAAAHRALAVHRVRVRIGELSGIDLRRDDWLMVEIALKLVRLRLELGAIPDTPAP